MVVEDNHARNIDSVISIVEADCHRDVCRRSTVFAVIQHWFLILILHIPSPTPTPQSCVRAHDGSFSESAECLKRHMMGRYEIPGACTCQSRCSSPARLHTSEELQQEEDVHGLSCRSMGPSAHSCIPVGEPALERRGPSLLLLLLARTAPGHHL